MTPVTAARRSAAGRRTSPRTPCPRRSALLAGCCRTRRPIGTPARRCPRRSRGPTSASLGMLVLAAELERDATEDRRGQDQEQRQVEAAEQRGVPLEERGERRAAGHDQPDLVAVPHRADRVHHDPAVDLVPAQEGQEDADAEVEALEEEVADPEDADQREPQRFEVQVALVHPATSSIRAPTRRSAPVGRLRPGEPREQVHVDHCEQPVDHGEADQGRQHEAHPDRRRCRRASASRRTRPTAAGPSRS